MQYIITLKAAQGLGCKLTLQQVKAVMIKNLSYICYLELGKYIYIFQLKLMLFMCIIILLKIIIKVAIWLYYYKMLSSILISVNLQNSKPTLIITKKKGI